MKLVALVYPKNIQFQLQEKLSSSKLFTIQQKKLSLMSDEIFSPNLTIFPQLSQCLRYQVSLVLI